MSWTCKLHAARPENPQIGDMWPLPMPFEETPEFVASGQPYPNGRSPMEMFSEEYRRDWFPRRAPLVVMLPGTGTFCIDSMASGNHPHGWTVTGDAPNVTLTPSVNAVGVYHGWIQNGVITDDCEGRTFA